MLSSSSAPLPTKESDPENSNQIRGRFAEAYHIWHTRTKPRNICSQELDPPLKRRTASFNILDDGQIRSWRRLCDEITDLNNISAHPKYPMRNSHPVGRTRYNYIMYVVINMSNTSAHPRNNMKNLVSKCIPGAVLTLLYSFLISSLMLVPPLYMMQVFDRVLSSHSMGTLLGLTILAVMGCALYGIIEFIRSRAYLIMGNWIGRKLSDDLMSPILSQSLRGQGSPAQTLRDVGNVKSFIAGGGLTSGLELFWSPLFIVVLWLLHPTFGVIVIAGAIILIIIAIIAELTTRRPTLEATDVANKAYNQIGESLQNAETIAAMGILPRVIRRWREAEIDMLFYSDKAANYGNLFHSISRSFRLALQVMIFAVAAFLVVDKQISPAVIIAAALISTRALAPIESLIVGWRSWTQTWVSFDRLVNVIEEFEKNPRSKMFLPRPKGDVEYDKVFFSAPGSKKLVIRNVSFSISAGEIVALVGPSGAGKSTLARLTVGVWPASSGAVRLYGHDVYQWDRESFGEYVGYLPQSIELFTGTVRENISRLKDAPLEEVVDAAKSTGVHNYISSMENGYDTRIGARGFFLTGGQRQRIGLARALFGNPTLLVLDEPDAHLDEEGQEALKEAVLFEQNKGKTIIVITHRKNLLQIANKIVFMKNGQIERISRSTDENVECQGNLNDKEQKSIEYLKNMK